ncbi:hypothetical protein LshimejAT787_0106790 [Lyophyllum shimeji]|uniref:Uncharacterized protein n=1 Tax=Lyophyllum shimeji TaxID=47721 RepID=A0A9P3PD66_LYOSH|nr:hypothetical protein LshimejAT787_0106790 [Lyophyllum shimeji]
MARKSFLPSLLFSVWTLYSSTRAGASTISTDTTVPPLQWINLSGLLQGASRPPPLKNAAIGYDEASRSIIVFGGESASGLAQSQTFLLNLETLTWSVPTPPTGLQRTPAARTSVIAGGDFAASNRHGFIVIGGRGSDGKGFTDVWEYDFVNQFWSQVNVDPGGPLPRWGASGGIDIFTAPIQDPVVPGPNNTFYLAGGYDGTRPSSFSDIWRLNVSGTLSSNLPNDARASWDHLTIGSLPSKFNQSGTVVEHEIILTGGCTSLTSNGVCAEQNSYLVDTQRRSEDSPDVCPAPRTNPVLVPSASQFNSNFASQVYLLLGIIDKDRWDDDGGLDRGEVAILDIQAGTWSRILPSGDPGTSGTPTFPSPRQGSAAFSYPNALVGQDRNASSDTLVFGGQDASGNLLSEVWLLRAYRGVVSPSNPVWSGFGDGKLRTGVNANGAGVGVTFMTKCASEISSPTGTSPSSTTSFPNSTMPAQSLHRFDTSLTHKILAPVSLAILQAAFLLFRFTSPLYRTGGLRVKNVYGSAVLALVAYALGIAGFATAFSAISAPKLAPASGLHLQTGHGIAGLIFFALLYAILPLLLVLYSYNSRPSTLAQDSVGEKIEPAPAGSPTATETYDWPSSRSAPQSLHNASSPSSPRLRTNSWGPSSTMYRSHEGRLSSDSESLRSPSPKRGFEVLNRTPRARQPSGSWLAVPFAEASVDRLRDIDWLQRRRSVNAVGELDYALTQLRREQILSTPATADGLMATTPPNPSPPPLASPDVSTVTLHIVFQALFLGMSILTLIALWSRAPKATFGVFLAWTLAFYIIMATFAWQLRPDRSLLSVARSRLSPQRQTAATRTASITEVTPGPYVHQPPHQVASGRDDASLSQAGPLSAEADEEDDVDDETRQREIEGEIARRDVSIVTIPKRKLWVANP